MTDLSREEFFSLVNSREASNDSCKTCYSWWVMVIYNLFHKSVFLLDGRKI